MRLLFSVIGIVAFGLLALIVAGAVRDENHLVVGAVFLGIVGLVARWLGRKRRNRER